VSTISACISHSGKTTFTFIYVFNATRQLLENSTFQRKAVSGI